MFDPYIIIIGAGFLIGISYVFDIVSKRTRVPSVVFLIGTGIILKFMFIEYASALEQEVDSMLELFGIVGLIMIVLEAAVDLKISKSKLKVISLSLFLAIIVLLISALAIAGVIMFFLQESFFISLVYAIPLSVVSSAVLIPSIHTLTPGKKEFMIYESTFSDITGIMFFNFIVLNNGNILSVSGIGTLFFTIIISVVLSYILVFAFSKLTTSVKLFMMIAILAILYSVGKQLHISSLLIILIFGLILNNSKFFFRGPIDRFINHDTLGLISKEFRLITAESAFVVRTFFFVTFGFSINLSVLTDPLVLIIGASIVLILYLVRYLNFKIILKTNVFPEIFLAPRGLITILLFYSIPSAYLIEDFSEGILFFVILSTSIIMMIALIRAHATSYEDLTIESQNIQKRHEPGGPYCEIDPEENEDESLDCIDNIKDAKNKIDTDNIIKK